MVFDADSIKMWQVSRLCTGCHGHSSYIYDAFDLVRILLLLSCAVVLLLLLFNFFAVI